MPRKVANPYKDTESRSIKIVANANLNSSQGIGELSEKNTEWKKKNERKKTLIVV